MGIQVSAGQLSNFLVKGQEAFHVAKQEVCEAGLASSPFQHIDQTGMRVDGKNQHCTIVCNSLYTSNNTTPSKRDISFGPRTQEDVKAWDTFMSLVATTKKLGISFHQYVHDHISKAGQIPSLASLVEARARELGLGASWSAVQLAPNY